MCRDIDLKVTTKEETMKTGKTVTFRKVTGKVLALYRYGKYWNLNLLKKNGLTASWTYLTKKDIDGVDFVTNMR